MNEMGSSNAAAENPAVTTTEESKGNETQAEVDEKKRLAN